MGEGSAGASSEGSSEKSASDELADQFLTALAEEDSGGNGPNDRKVDIVLLTVTANLKIFIDEIKGLRSDVQSVRFRTRTVVLFAAVTALVLIFAVIFGPIAIHANNTSAATAKKLSTQASNQTADLQTALNNFQKAVDARGLTRSQQQCDAAGSQLVIYHLLLATPGLGSPGQIAINEAIGTNVTLRNQLNCPAYRAINPATGKLDTLVPAGTASPGAPPSPGG